MDELMPEKSEVTVVGGLLPAMYSINVTVY